MKSAEIRRAYLEFFEARGHTIHPSAPIVPENDPTLLFTGAGMNQFKEMFLGKGNLGFSRATTTQKCLRVPDLDEVGRTPSHHTFFEMLGNFSFGDYFKSEAIAWADELLREVFGIDRARLRISVYTDDDEAYELWKKLGYPAEHIFRYGEDDNYWPASAPSKGPNGPCGPCSEIYYDFGAEIGGGDDPAENGRRFAEIWNLVFTQFDRRDGGELAPLPQRNIDTGMGFERMTRVLQGGQSNFDTDLFQPILAAIQEFSSRDAAEDESVGRAMRRIADHVRAGVFCVSDGVVPSNEKQGYVVRKILRRAIADGLDSLGIRDPFLGRLVPVIVGVPGMKETFPELGRFESKIAQVLDEEEAKFRETYDKGRSALSRELEQRVDDPSRVLPGKVAFFLWDTAGFPLDLTRRVLDDQGWSLDEEGFEKAMDAQREKSRAGSKIKAEIFAGGPLTELKKSLPPTQFVGHEELQLQTRLGAVLRGDESVDAANEGEEVVLLFERTPFYAEGGGQVGDRGVFVGANGRVRIHDTTKLEGYFLHSGAVVDGTVQVGEIGSLQVDPEHREPTIRNHTATHLVHWALRRVLGTEVEQKGSLVQPERLRFDFSYPSAVPAEQLAEVETLVNEQVVRNLPVSKNEKSFDEAVKDGAMALFGEKYGDVVRVVKVEDSQLDRCSVELCGGTHVRRTGDIGLFKLVSEGGISAGVRRIEAVTGLGALRWVQGREGVLVDTARSLKAPPEELGHRVASLQDEIKKLRKELKAAAKGGGGSGGDLDAVLARRKEMAGLAVYVAPVQGGAKETAAVADGLKDREKGGLVAVLLGDEGGRVPVIVTCNEAAQAAGLQAGALCRSMAAILGGGGGGNPGFARGQGQDGSKRDEALAAAEAEITRALGSPPA